jgi:putative phosphoribosyl transferase
MPHPITEYEIPMVFSLSNHLKRDLLFGKERSCPMDEIFHDRVDAGKRLAAKLKETKRDDLLILALPRGGVEVASEVAKAYKVPVDVLFVRKLGAEFNPELGVGAIVEGNPPQAFLNEDLVRVLKVTDEFLAQEKKKQSEVMAGQQKLYRGGKARPSATGKQVIVIDDGIATGATVHAALKGLKSEKPKKLTLAIGVAPPSTIAELKKEVDEIVCLLQPNDFQAVGQFFRHFPHLEDQRVIDLLNQKY